MSKIDKIEKDGLTYEVHQVAVDGGKTNIGVVNVPAPDSLEQLASMVEGGVDSESHICQLYVSAKAVEMQRQARTAKKGGKMPQATFERIFNALSDDDKMGKKWPGIVAKVNEVYAEELA